MSNGPAVALSLPTEGAAMTAIEWVCVAVLAFIPVSGFIVAVCDEVGQSREAKKDWQKRRIIELEAACGIKARDSWYANE